MIVWAICLYLQIFSDAYAFEIIQLNQQYGVIESPNFPGPYEDNAYLSWQIHAPENYQIVVYFTIFDLEDSYDEELGGACAYDYVQLEHLETSIRLCGNHNDYPGDAPAPQQRFRSKNNVMTIRFVSDYSNEDRHVGFKAHYVIEDKDECAEMRHNVDTAFEDWDELVYCNHFCVNVPGSYHCTCRVGFELHENEHTCKASCENELITDTEGVITSSDYPKPYSKLTDCKWTIRVNPGFSLNLQFDNLFEIETHLDYPVECVYDRLKLQYGDTDEEFCHKVPNNGSLIAANAREVRLEFYTDNSVEKAGFSMSFTTMRTRCLEPRNAPQDGMKPDNPKKFYEFEDVIEFSCNPGYNLIGSNSTTCQHDGMWSDLAPTCQIKWCGPPNFLQNVSYSQLNFTEPINYTYRDIVEVECNQWYEMTFGVGEWRCSEDAEWIPTAPGSDVTEVPICTAICGVKNGEGRPRFVEQIAYGVPAHPHEWPWQVYINHGLRANYATQRGICGGAIISPKYVLTAAHCVSGSNEIFHPNGFALPHNVFVFPGLHNRAFNFGRQPSYVDVSRIFIHPYHDSATLNFDFAVLELAKTLLMTENIRPICLPNTTEEFELMNLGETTGEVAGWGIHAISGRASNILMHTTMPTVNNTHCWNKFQRAAEHYNIDIRARPLNEYKFCAGDPQGGAGTPCEGDSGGPFMVEDEEIQKYYTFGLVSYGISCNTNSINKTVRDSVSYSVFARLNEDIVHWVTNIIIN